MSNIASSSTLPIQVRSRKPSQYESLLAGIIAGSVEGAVTYPTEFVKTQAQFASRSNGPVRKPSLWRYAVMLIPCSETKRCGDNYAYGSTKGHQRVVFGIRGSDSWEWPQGRGTVPQL
jgi:hypothetical protein